MTTAIENKQNGSMGADLAEKVLVGGDLSKLSSGERLLYVTRLCESLGLNPATRPFEYITLQGKLTLYARKDATEQLRKLHNVSIELVRRERIEDVYVVEARGSMPNGRFDTSIGAVTIKGLTGDNLANALMKAETKAKRRVTLSICGLGMLDENEVETIPDALPMPTRQVDTLLSEADAESKEKRKLTRRLVDKATKLGLDKDTLRAYVKAMTGKEDANHLTIDEWRTVSADLDLYPTADAVFEFLDKQPIGTSPKRPSLVEPNEEALPDYDEELPFPSAGDSAASDKQVKAIYAIGRAAKRLSEGQVDERCMEIFGVGPTELTKAEASQYIDVLKGDAV